MLIRLIKKLKKRLAYTLYIKMYGITETPFEPTEVHLSESDNEWNTQALLASDTVKLFERLPKSKREEESVVISETDNEWNKLAIRLE